MEEQRAFADLLLAICSGYVGGSHIYWSYYGKPMVNVRTDEEDEDGSIVNEAYITSRKRLIVNDGKTLVPSLGIRAEEDIYHKGVAGIVPYSPVNMLDAMFFDQERIVDLKSLEGVFDMMEENPAHIAKILIQRDFKFCAYFRQGDDGPELGLCVDGPHERTIGELVLGYVKHDPDSGIRHFRTCGLVGRT